MSIPQSLWVYHEDGKDMVLIWQRPYRIRSLVLTQDSRFLSSMNVVPPGDVNVGL